MKERRTSALCDFDDAVAVKIVEEFVCHYDAGWSSCTTTSSSMYCKSVSPHIEEDVDGHNNRHVSLFEDQDKTYRLLQDVLVGQEKLTVWELDVEAEAKSRACVS